MFLFSIIFLIYKVNYWIALPCILYDSYPYLKIS